MSEIIRGEGGIEMYIAENIDSKKALQHISEARKRYQAEKKCELKSVESYYRGFEAGLDLAEDMFYCRNYEKIIDEGSGEE